MLADQISEALPQVQGFLRSYTEYASACSDAPAVYHAGVGLTILSATVAKRLRCPWMAGRTLLPNLYTLLVGSSRSARKTGSMDAGIEILNAADHTLVMPIPGSYEELVAQIRRKPEGLLTYREFGHFLKTTQRGYTEPIRTMLMDLYDWPPDRQFTRNLRKGQTIIDPPIVLSMLAAVSTDLLYRFSDLEDWTGGFFGRFVVLFAERNEFKMPNTWQPARDQLSGWLAALNAYPMAPPGGFAADAWAYFEKWARHRDGQASHFPVRVQTFVAGATTLAAKIALLFAVDAGECMAGVGWLVSLESVYRAIRFVDTLYLPSVEHLGERLALGTWEMDRQRVLDVIERAHMGVSRRDLIRKVKVSSDYCDQIIGTLKEEGSISQINGHSGVLYRRAWAAPAANEGGGGTVVRIGGARTGEP